MNEPTGHVVHIAKIVADGAGYKEEDGGNIFGSTDSWTAPVYAETGPDGNLWIADWYNPVIQHNPDKRGMDNQIWNADRGPGNAHLNPLRDKGHGRIYILKHKNGRESSIKSLEVSDLRGLLAGLESENMFWRTTAQRLIVEHGITEVIPDLITLSTKDSPGAMHALWALDGLGALDGSQPEARAAADRALSAKPEGAIRAALALLPETTAGSETLAASELLMAENMHIRLTALLRASELPETDRLYQAMEQVAQDEVAMEDKWLRAAVNIYFRKQNYEDIDKEQVVMVIPSAEEGESVWRYTEKEPASNWYSTNFDDASWEEGPAILGTADPGPDIQTPWASEHIWMRKTVNLEDEIAEPVLKVIHDENYEVYVNGKLLFAEKGYTRSYKFIRLDAELSSLFQKGENVMAVYCHNASGNQFIDVGIGKVGTFEADRKLIVNTVPQKMAYDQPVLRAMAGEEVEIVLNNLDEMPHNLVLIEAGSLEAFGKLVDKFLESPEAAAQQYVPKSRYVLGATQMIDPSESGSIRLRIPDKPGSYPFICTYPGIGGLCRA